MANSDVRLRGSKESRNNLQDLRVALYGVVKSRDIDEGHHPPVESELLGDFDLGRIRLQTHSDPCV